MSYIAPASSGSSSSTSTSTASSGASKRSMSEHPSSSSSTTRPSKRRRRAPEMVDLTQQHNPDHRQHGDGEHAGADTAAAGLLGRLFSRFGLASWMVGGESGNSSSSSSSSLPTTAVTQGSSSHGSDSDSRAQGYDAPSSSGSTARSSANGSQSRYSTQASQPQQRSNGTGARQLQTQTQTQTQSQFSSGESWRDADEDDDMGLPNGSTSSHGMSGARSSQGHGGSYIRRTPMYTEHTRAAQQAKSKARLDYFRQSGTPLLSPISPAGSLVPSNGTATSDTFLSISTPSSALTPSARTPSSGGDYANYSKRVEAVNDAFGPSLSIFRGVARYRGDATGLRNGSGRFSQGDVLTARRPQQQHARFPRMEQTLETGRQALESPRPKPASLTSFKRLNLKDQELSDSIEESQYRRRKWPRESSAELVALVEEAFRIRGVITTLPGAEVSAKDLALLKPTTWLNDEVINFYGVMVNIRSAAAKARRDKGKAQMLEGDEDLLDVHVFSSHFFSKLANSGYSGVRKWSKKFDFFSKDIVIMPVNLGNMHWVCAAINLKAKRFEYYDAMGRMNLGILRKLREYTEAEHLDKKGKPLDTADWTDYSNPKTPQQSNGWDCGVFSSQFIESLSRKGGQFDFTQKNMAYLRHKMVAEIKKGEFIPEEYL